MIPYKTLADLIQEKIYLSSENERGFCTVKCACCNDYQERGGFKFDGETTGYSCWNCGSRFKYEENTGKFSKNCRDVLLDFGITREDLQKVGASVFFNKPEKSETEITLKSLTKMRLDTPEVALPGQTYPLGKELNQDLQKPLLEYLSNRHIKPDGMMYSLEPEYLRRVIIPFYRDGKIIYWQARAIDDVKRRYLNSPVSKEAIIYGYDQLNRYEEAPLFITEGVFDAIPLNGACIIGSKLNEAKIEILKRSRRRKIFVIDKDITGSELAKSVIDLGWELTHVDVRADDVNHSIVQFGLPYTVYSLLKNVTSNISQVDKKFSKMAVDMERLKAQLRKSKYA